MAENFVTQFKHKSYFAILQLVAGILGTAVGYKSIACGDYRSTSPLDTALWV
jgi:hypothetical protein